MLGNHESETMNQMYGFQDEVKVKYSSEMADLFTEVYNWLPLAHCINDRVLVSQFCYKIMNIFLCGSLISVRLRPSGVSTIREQLKSRS